jgi:cytochrome c oxidase subunit 2
VLVAYDAARSGQINFQRPATQTMDQLIALHHDIFSLLLFICTIVFYLLVVIAYKFNATNMFTARNFFFEAHTTLEIAWTLLPMFVVLLILYPSFALLYAMDELKDPSLTVKIIGHQWYWTYEIPISFENTKLKRLVIFDSYMLAEEDLPFGGFRLLEVDNRLRLPVKTVIRLLITSSDVLHSWAVPSFGVKVDACPGRLNQASVYIERLGVFFGQCSEICGINHGFMPITVESLICDEFLKSVK